MSTETHSQFDWQTIKELPQKVIQFMSGAMARLFGLNEDDYPGTGVQPFEGDPADKKHF
jgi:hypothetical protein